MTDKGIDQLFERRDEAIKKLMFDLCHTWWKIGIIGMKF